MVVINGLDYKKSTRKNKKLMVEIMDGNRKRTIHFGGDPDKSRHFFDKTGLLDKELNHKDKKIRKAWYARHGKIKLKDGSLAINNKLSPLWHSAKILW